MKAIIVSFCIIGLLFGCGETPPSPSGYKVLCSVDGEKYTLWMPNEFDYVDGKLKKGRLSANIWDSERAAIDYAWYWESLDDKSYIAESDNGQAV